MKRTHLPVLFLIVLLALAACGGSAPAPEAVVEAAPTAAPTEPPPTPTPEPPPTAPPTATAEPTPTAAPTEPVCDIERLREAAENVALLDSYALSGVGYGQMPDEQLRLPMLHIESTVAMSGGQVLALDLTLDSAAAEATARMILVDDILYYRSGSDPWEVASELLSEIMASDVSSGQTIDVAVLEVINDRPCAPFSERIDGRDAAGYHFTEVDLAELAAVSASVANLGNLPAEAIRATEFKVWVAEVEDVPHVVKWQFNITFDEDGGEAVVETTIVVSDFNEPVDIRAPEGVVAAAFALELPRPDDALLYLEDAATLAFFTDSAPEEMKTLYSDLLTAEGWTPGENRKETIEGTNMDVLPFSRGEEQLEMGIAVTDAGTLVVFTLPPEE